MMMLAWIGAGFGILGALLDVSGSNARYVSGLLGGLLTLPYCFALHAIPAVVLLSAVSGASLVGLFRVRFAQGQPRRRGQVFIPLARKSDRWSR